MLIVEINNKGVTGRILPPNTDFEHVRVWPTYFRLRFLDHDRHTDIILDKMVPTMGRASSYLEIILYVR